jgi:electron transfer flavoprotein alpha subunit
MATGVFAEESGGAPTPGALELVSRAATMGPVTVFYVGTGSPESLATLGSYGATTVHHLDTGDALPAAPAAAALAGLLAGSQASVVLFGMGNTDRDVAGMLAARMGAALVANALDVSTDGAVTVTSEINGGSLGITTEVTGSGPAIVITRPKAFVAESTGGGAPEIHTVAMPDTGHAGDATITERNVEASEGPDLEADSTAGMMLEGKGLRAHGPAKSCVLEAQPPHLGMQQLAQPGSIVQGDHGSLGGGAVGGVFLGPLGLSQLEEPEQMARAA